MQPDLHMRGAGSLMQVNGYLVPPDHPIVSFFCPAGVFFGSVSDSTPS